MNLQELITNELSPLEPTDTSTLARSRFEASHTSHLPVVEAGTYLGCLPAAALQNAEGKSVADHQAQWERERFLPAKQSLLDALQTMRRLGGNLLPLLDDQGAYLGYVTTAGLMDRIAAWPAFMELGAVITLETDAKGYAMGEITTVVESQGARILGCFISGYQDDRVEIALKVNLRDLSPLAEGFARFGYEVKEKFYSDIGDEVLRDRYQGLMKYLDV